MGTMEALTAALEANTEALNANTAALAGGGGGSTAKAADKKPTAAEKKAAAAAKEKAATPKRTPDEVREKLVECSDTCGEDVAKGIIKDAGFSKLAELVKTPEKLDEAYDAAQAAIDEADGGDDNGGL